MTPQIVSPDHRFLSKHPLLRTRDLDEARFCVAQKFCDHRLETKGRDHGLSVEHNHAAGHEVSLNYLHYGADVAIDPGMLQSFYLLQIPLVGQALVAHRGEEVAADGATATLLNPDRDTKMQWQAGCKKLLLQVNKDHLHAMAETLSGAPLPGPVRFDTRVDLSTPNGRALRRMIVACALAIDRGALHMGRGAGQDLRVEMELAHALLTLQHSNVTHILERQVCSGGPRSLCRAVDYVHANLSEVISVADIACAAGVSVRALQKGFQQRYGRTPMQYLRDARLDAAHYRLSARRDRPQASDAAFECGFTHLGRFSRDYKARFGVSPSLMGRASP